MLSDNFRNVENEFHFMAVIALHIVYKNTCVICFPIIVLESG